MEQSSLPFEKMKEDAGRLYDLFKDKYEEDGTIDTLAGDVACHCLALLDHVDKTQKTLTCVYCGMEYPEGTPSWGSSVLTEHIKVCTKHPLRRAEETIVKLRGALSDLIGSEDMDEAQLMLDTMDEITDQFSDCISMSTGEQESAKNALKVLIETEDWNREQNGHSSN